MNKSWGILYWILVIIIILLTILRYSGRLFSLSTYQEVFVLTAGALLVIGLLFYVYKKKR